MIEIIEIVLLLLLPISLIFFRIVPFKYRMHLLTLSFVGSILIMFFEGWTLSDAGFRTDNLLISLIPYIIFTVGSIALAYIYLRIVNKKPKNINPQLLYYFIPISFAQEILFRSFIVTKLSNITNSWIFITLLSTVLFVVAHLIYTIDHHGILLLIISGAGFTIMYLTWPNLILIGLAHSALNLYIVRYGFFKEPSSMLI